MKKIICIIVLMLLITNTAISIASQTIVDKDSSDELNDDIENDNVSPKDLFPNIPRILNMDWNYWKYAPDIFLYPDGNVGIGTEAPEAKLDVVGNIAINGMEVINSNGMWVGDPTGLVGPEGPPGPQGEQGPPGELGLDGIQGRLAWFNSDTTIDDSMLFFSDFDYGKLGISSYPDTAKLKVFLFHTLDPEQDPDYLALFQTQKSVFDPIIDQVYITKDGDAYFNGDVDINGVLNVDGRIDVDGRIYYESPPTFTYNIPAAEFKLITGFPFDRYHLTQSGYRYATPPEGGTRARVELICPVHLPQSAEVISLAIYIYDNWGDMDLDITAHLYRRPLLSTSTYKMATIDYTTPDWQSTNIITTADVTIGNPVIDNDEYQYYVYVEYDQNHYGGPYMRFYGGKIRYNMPMVSN